ncbi:MULTISPECIES: hypothetical protein [Shewanella]|uniref:Uncharacterized protein n=1 Tax=Shewanella indica TaxID=768528 RepID=A0ABU4QBM8_9GAMM|nr:MULTISPECIES: hypothetical protein [Shewanella]MDX6016221.1 hypothetical protein [Shewanella indica]
MPITAYSNTYKRELDATQLESLFNESPHSLDVSFQNFVKNDIECPSCNVTGGYIVSEGICTRTGRTVSQAHFAFRNAQGVDAHLPFCDFYDGEDKQKLVSNEGRVDFRRSQSAITRQIGVIVSIGIENNIFSQGDMRDMRQWFLDLRKSGQELFDISPHIVNLARSSYVRSKRNFEKFVPDVSEASKEGFDIDREVYESLSHQYPHYKLIEYYKENPFYLEIAQKAVVKKAIKIIRNDSNFLSFDRSVLLDKYQLTRKLSDKIVQNDGFLSQNLSPSAIFKSNPLMALSALLLFVSNWDIDEAWGKVEIIYKIRTVKDHDAGNFIGLNPFANYSAWVIIKKLMVIKDTLEDNLDYDYLFNEEKSRLMKLYGLKG